MPHKGGKNKTKEAKKACRKDSNSEIPHPAQQDEEGAVGGELAEENQNKNFNCCVPNGCENTDLINVNDPGDAVKVTCNNEHCDVAAWMHANCFIVWEESVLSYLRSCGRARSWSEKQRLQNLWTKKGYDLAYKACDCKCGRGHLRKDLDYIPKPSAAAAKKKHHKKSSELPTLTVSSKGHHVQPQLSNKEKHKEHRTEVKSDSNGSASNGAPQPRERGGSFGSPNGFRERVSSFGSNNGFRERVNSNSSNGSAQRELSSPRDRSNSFGVNNAVTRPSMTIPAARNRHLSSQSMTSTGSSPPNSSNSMESPSSSSPGTPCTPVFGKPGSRKSKFDFFSDGVTIINGNIFRRRESLSSFSCLPRHKRNPYHIKMEDDNPHGNDDTRNFILNNLSLCKASAVHCLLCRNTMPVFDRYPLVDGTFFLSPVSYDDVVSFPVEFGGNRMHLHAVCISCLEGAVRLLCQFCNQTWDGSTLVLGTMYAYDIFAAAACCDKRFTCKACSASVLGIKHNVHYFSEFSRKLQCQRCHSEDHHFIKPLQELYYAQSICN